MVEITKDMVIADLLRTEIAQEAVSVLQSIGMHCLGCPSSSGESIEDACLVHGMDPDKLISELNSHFEKATV